MQKGRSMAQIGDALLAAFVITVSHCARRAMGWHMLYLPVGF